MRVWGLDLTTEDFANMHQMVAGHLPAQSAPSVTGVRKSSTLRQGTRTGMTLSQDLAHGAKMAYEITARHDKDTRLIERFKDRVVERATFAR